MMLLIFLSMIISTLIIRVENHQVPHSDTEIKTVGDDPGYINVRSAPYNAKGDGVTDDTDAFQRALNDAGNSGGGIVLAPEGNYLIGSQLSLPDATVLRGVASHVQRQWGDPNSKKIFGTTLLAVANAGNENAPPFITLAGDSSGIEGLAIFYPNQVVRDPPIVYPWTIRLGQKGKSIENNFVKNVLLVNPWKGIDAASNEPPRHWFENIYGQPLALGIAVDQCYDIGRINHIHFWPFWSQDPVIMNWVNNNGVTFLFQRTDWEVVEDVFSFGYHAGMVFTKSAVGACNGQFTDINFDNVDIGIDVSYTQTPGILFSNLNLANAGGGSNRLGIFGRGVNGSITTDVTMVVRGGSFWGYFNQHIVWSHPGLISYSNSLFSHWNQTRPLVEIQRGRAMLTNNYFSDNTGSAVTIAAGVEKASVTDNLLNGNTINAPTRSSVVIANNVP